MVDLISPIATVVHDMGAANHVLGLLQDVPNAEIRICAEGPARELFCKEFPELKNGTVYESLHGANTLLSGTSAKSNLEHESRLLARNLNIPSIAVVEHWANYRIRFIRNNEMVLPDEIWISDDFAFELAKSCFPGHPIQQVPNRYLENMINKIKDSSKIRRKKDITHVLYVLEPIVKQWGDYKTPGEFLALNYFVEKMDVLGLGEKTEIRLRAHPSDPLGKYDDWCLVNSNLNISVDTNNDLADLIAWADYVVGCETYALVIALNANRRTFSTLPPCAPARQLPHKEIMSIRDL
jgi:hypothetical protein